MAFLNLISLIKDKKLIIVASHDDELKSDKIITLSEEKYIAFKIEKLNSNYDNKNKNLSYKRKLFSTMKRFELIPFVFGIALMLISIYIASAINNNLYENYDDPDAYVTNVRNDDAYDALKTAYENNIIEDMTIETRFCLIIFQIIRAHGFMKNTELKMTICIRFHLLKIIRYS